MQVWVWSTTCTGPAIPGSAVNNLIDIHILKSLTLRKTVDKMLTVNGDIGKFAAA